MAKVIILKGLPASGKSTWAKEQVANGDGKIKRVNKDDLRMMMDNSFWTPDNEHIVIEIRNKIIMESLRAGCDIIVDDTNLNPKMERGIRKLVEPEYEVEVNSSFLSVPLSSCIWRDSLRDSPVGEDIITKMHNDWKKWQYADCSVMTNDDSDKVEYDFNLDDAIIFDLDGTIAINDGHRSFYDYSRVIDDKLNIPVHEIISNFENRCTLIAMSGRDDICMDDTTAWLHKYSIPFDHLYMRKTGDKRKDSIVKKELFDNNIRGEYNILFVLDDRTQVVKMWRDVLGLTCLQVNWGNF